jgi:hypothetical protein
MITILVLHKHYLYYQDCANKVLFTINTKEIPRNLRSLISNLIYLKKNET